MQYTSWQSLFAAMESLEAAQTSQKQQGLNDFNLLSSVLSVNDEVRLHTRFIYSLLNPEGRHYQRTRFLEIFLDVIGRQGWLELSSIMVWKEVSPNGKGDQIDLLISDGNRQIVIENKLNAQDQPRQVLRYLEAVGATDPDRADDTLFIYLTKNRESPSARGLGVLRVCPQSLYLRNARAEPMAQYQNISYRRSTRLNSIHAWLDLCANAVAQRSNLSWAIRDYQAAVERATKEYVSKVKTLKDTLEDGFIDGKRYHEQAIQLARELPAIHASWLDQALTVNVDEMFESLVSEGVVTKIESENTELLNPFLSSGYQGNSADLLYERKYNFFSSGHEARSRGTFYQVETGRFAKQAILMLFYGSQMLHVGCLLTDHAENQFPEVLAGLNLSKPGALRKNIFPRAMTYAEPLEYQGIIHLADFMKSPQREILEQVAKALCFFEATAVAGETM
ncbi:PDDEXK-like family protein [Marinimicrobium sp. C2-29]|uniref:PDDEXK-like family protein n=1 Tax=Marinimicrobium sp. C2-29 TaxID=3139825 RepID=UPI00313A0FA0